MSFRLFNLNLACFLLSSVTRWTCRNNKDAQRTINANLKENYPWLNNLYMFLAESAKNIIARKANVYSCRRGVGLLECCRFVRAEIYNFCKCKHTATLPSQRLCCIMITRNIAPMKITRNPNRVSSARIASSPKNLYYTAHIRSFE